MRAIADRFGIESFEYTNISPTIHGGDEVLPSQSREMPRTRKPYVGCNAGITHFHADPHGKASTSQDGTSREVMDCLPPGSLSPADDAPGAATPASLPASRTQGGRAEQVR